MTHFNRKYLIFILIQISALFSLSRSQAASLNTSYYSIDYAASRARFKSSAMQLSATWPKSEMRAFKVPSQTDNDLTVDYLYLPAQVTSERLVIVTSGVHGIEGFAGSAIQQMVFSEFAKSFERARTGYLFVHAVNPYGFKYHRRATENNVNLNRNFSVSDEMYTMQNGSYMKIAALLEPRGVVSKPQDRFFETSYDFGSRILTGQVSIADLTKSIGMGQYESSKGLEYGGTANEPQTKDLILYLAKVSAPYHDLILLDLHTGLGESYQLHVMPGDADRSTDPKLFAKLFHVEEDAVVYKYTPSTTAGFYPTSGDIVNILPQLMNPQQRAVGVTIEFGTVGNGVLPKLQTVNRLILENQGFHYGYLDSSAGQVVRDLFDDLFYPDDAFWRDNVLNKARETFKRILERMDQAEAST